MELPLGLTTEEAQQKSHTFGKNIISTENTTTALTIFFSQFPTLINAILAAAALFSFFIQAPLDSFFILAVLLINALFGFIQEYRAEKSLEKLKKYVKPITRVIRDGQEREIPTTDIVPGDTLVLSEGDRIPADGKLIASHPIEIDEAILTGESLPIIKNHNDVVFSGTLITQGNGKMLVEQTGMRTRFGQIAKTLADVKADKTPLQKRLDSLAKVLSLLVILISALLIPIGIFQGKSLLPLILLAVSIGVAAIPEGLPAVITIALAIGTNRMAKKRAIVRKMPAVETLGAVQVILVDKTGTLTENSMRVKKYWTPTKDALPFIYKASVLGNTASLLKTPQKDTYNIVGDKTDGALLLWVHQQEQDAQQVLHDGKVLEEHAFDSETKTVTTVWEEHGHRFVYVRGAPEAILAKTILTNKEQEKIKHEYESYAKEGLRVIAFAYKKEHHDSTQREHIEKHLVFLGIVGIYDPPRKEVIHAVLAAKQAGIRTVMVTGDNELTALAIAKEVGLIEKNEDVVTGNDLAKLPDEELLQVIEQTRIFARTKPEDKLRLTSLFKQKGFIVAVTGDGVNDALALKRADVGISMGESGTDVAKEASDIILLDDNFSTLIQAVAEGRTIYNNILKSITYLITSNFSEIALIFFAVLFGMPNPLLPTQILWMNIVTDGIPALALASDTKNPHVLKGKPRDPKMPMFSKDRLLFIVLGGILITILLLLLFNISLNLFSETKARTIVFNALIFSHMLLAFIIRGKSIFRPNKFLIIGVTLTIFLQIFVTIHPFFQEILHLEW